MKSNSMALLILLATVIAQAQVTPPRTLPQQQPLTQRPLVPAQTNYLTNALQRRFSLPGQTGATRTLNPPRVSPPGIGATNNIPSPLPAPNGIMGTNVRRQAPMGTNLIPPRVFNTNSALTNFARTNSAGLLDSTNGLRTSRAITPAQRIQIGKLAADLNSMRLASQISPVQREQLLATLRTSGLGTFKASNETINQFVNNLLTVWPTQGFGAPQKSQLAIDLNRILNASDLSAADSQAVINDARRIFQTSGMSSQAVEMLTRDLSLIAAQAQGRLAPVGNLPAAESNSRNQTSPR
jgi:hypothetical protein